MREERIKMENNPFWRKVTECFRGEVDPFSIETESGNRLEHDTLRRINDNLNRFLFQQYQRYNRF